MTPDALLKAAAAALLLAFAVVVVSAAPRRLSNLLLGGFFLLLAGNQGAETLRALAATDAERLLWYRVAGVFAALDPYFLFHFAAARAAEGRKASAGPAVAVALAGSAALAWWAGRAVYEHASADFAALAFDVVLTLFTLALYAAVAAGSVRRFLESPDDAVERRLVPALLLVAVPVLWRAVGRVLVALKAGNVVDLTVHTWLAPAVAAAVTLAAYGLLEAGAARRPLPPEARRVLRVSFALAIALAAAIHGNLTRLPLPPLATFFAFVGQAGAALRWILFGSLLSVAVLRFDLLGLSLAARRRAARAVLAVAFVQIVLLAIGFAGLAWGRASLPVRGFDVGVLLVAVVLSQQFKTLVDGVGAALYGLPRPGDRSAALETYRAALAQAAGEGRDARVDRHLARLRAELDIDPREAAVLERMASSARAGALGTGALVAGRYRVARMLGRGASGRAFLARDELMERDVVLKELSGEGAEDLALHEARAAGSLQHPNVVTVYDVLPRPEGAVLVLEHAAGGSLADRLRGGPLAPQEAARVLDGVLRGIEAAHARGVVHRDLKPSNVLLAADGTPKVSDFGVARLRTGATVGAAADAFVGTPRYMAPEQRDGMAATELADVYAAGVVARECFGDAAPPAVEAVLARALARDPSARWPSARALREALAGAVTTGT